MEMALSSSALCLPLGLVLPMLWVSVDFFFSLVIIVCLQNSVWNTMEHKPCTNGGLMRELEVLYTWSSYKYEMTWSGYKYKIREMQVLEYVVKI